MCVMDASLGLCSTRCSSCYWHNANCIPNNLNFVSALSCKRWAASGFVIGLPGSRGRRILISGHISQPYSFIRLEHKVRYSRELLRLQLPLSSVSFGVFQVLGVI